jgi:hypothetical protein
MLMTAAMVWLCAGQALAGDFCSGIHVGSVGWRGGCWPARSWTVGHSGWSWGCNVGPTWCGPGIIDSCGPFPFWGVDPWCRRSSVSVFVLGRPPIYSANELFGPNLQGLWNPLGLGVRPAPQVNIIAFPRQADDLEEAADPQPRRPRQANAEAMARAYRFIDLGDRDFSAQSYRDAYQHYRDAARAAPNLPEAYLKQGQAKVATGQYDLAAAAFKRALKLGEVIDSATLDLADLYARQPIAQAAHLEALATSAEEFGEDADLLLLVGLELHFSQQADRAQAFLERAAEIYADSDAVLAAAVTQLSGGAPVEAEAQADDAEIVRF